MEAENIRKKYYYLLENCSKFYGWEDNYTLGFRRFKCKRCDFEISLDEIEVFRFCPICGANNYYTKGLVQSKVSHDVTEVFPWQKALWRVSASTNEDFKESIKELYEKMESL